MADRIYLVQPDDEGRLLKRVIRGTMGLSHRQFSMLKSSGALLLDGVPVHANAIVHAGQTISLTLVERPSHCAAPDDAPIDILYQDDDFMVVNKPAPLATQSSARQPGGTLENRLSYYFRDCPDFIFRPVNRLDKGTSGLLVVARHAHAQLLIGRQLHTDAFVRQYLAILCGVPDPPSGVVDLPIRKSDGPTVRREVHPDGKPARTHYRVLAVSGAHALVQLQLETGRTHQIRVHMAAIGCPVFGDFLYGQESELLPRRFALHCAHLALDHPTTGARLTFDALLPPELQAILNR
ncbi:MAG: RluA family pseudouridine synthase [Clostridia bacterium]